MNNKLKSQTLHYKLLYKKSFTTAVLTSELSVNTFIDNIAKELSGGIDIIELSAVNVPDNIFLDTAKKTKQLCDMFGTTFAIKNRTDIAYLTSADCVNLEQEAVDIQSARELLGEDFLIGLYMNSTNNSTLLSVKDGADYVLIPNNISTPTEPASSTGLEYAKWVSENTTYPVLLLNNADKIFPRYPIGPTYSIIKL